MAATKCAKCGANIPDAAGFCPACGAPKAAEQPAAQAQPIAAPQSGPKEPSSIPAMMNTIFAETLIYIMIFLGLLFVGIGGIISVFTFGTVFQIGFVLNSLGFFFMGTFLLMGGIVNKNFDQYVRFGMIIAGAVMLTWALAIAA